MIKENNYKKIKVISTQGLNREVRAIRFVFVDKDDAKKFSFELGSFIMVSIPGYGESPLTITTSPSQLPEFEIAVKTTGNTTTAINRLKVGDIAYLRGPFGKGIDFSKIYGRELVIIGGGIGIAPLRAIIQYISENTDLISHLTIIHSAKTPEDLLFKSELSKWSKFADVHVIVDKADSGWNGEKGYIPKILDKIDIETNATVLLCGPSAMYNSIIASLLKKRLQKNNILMMLERKMHCGIGKCQHCTCGNKYVCLDGPTFRYSEIENNWEVQK